MFAEFIELADKKVAEIIDDRAISDSVQLVDLNTGGWDEDGATPFLYHFIYRIVEDLVGV